MKKMITISKLLRSIMTKRGLPHFRCMEIYSNIWLMDSWLSNRNSNAIMRCHQYWDFHILIELMKAFLPMDSSPSDL